jgi:hypothetical protein
VLCSVTNIKPANEAHELESATSTRYIDEATRFLSFYTQTWDMHTSIRPYFTKAKHNEAWDTYMNHFHQDPLAKLKPNHWIATDEVYQASRRIVISVLFAFLCDHIEAPVVPDSSSPAQSTEELTEQRYTEESTEEHSKEEKPGDEKPHAYHPVSSFTILSCTTPGEMLAQPRDATRMIAALQWITRHTVWGYIQIRREGSKNPRRMQDDVVEQSGLWLRELKQTVFSWLRGIMHLGTSFVMSDSPIGRFTYIGNDTFIIDGQTITLTAWKHMVKTIMGEFQDRFTALCGFVGVTQDDLELPEGPYDHNSCETVNYWYGTEKRNALWAPTQSFMKTALSSELQFEIIGRC